MLEERRETNCLYGVLLFEGCKLYEKQIIDGKYMYKKRKNRKYYSVTNDCMNKICKKEIQENRSCTEH
jgi:hypothetical protein